MSNDNAAGVLAIITFTVVFFLVFFMTHFILNYNWKTECIERGVAEYQITNDLTAETSFVWLVDKK